MSLQQIAHIDEILDRIFVHLDTRTLVHNVQLVNKQWNRVAEPHTDYTYRYNWPIRWASKRGHLHLVQKLLSNPKVDPTSNENGALMQAAANGRESVVKELIKDPRVNPAALNNNALRLAARCGRLEVINVLLQDPRIDINVQDEYHNCSLVRLAAMNGHQEVINRLLQLGVKDPIFGVDYLQTK